MDEEEPDDDGLFVDSDETQTNNFSHFGNGDYRTPDDNIVPKAGYENTAEDEISQKR